MGVSESKPAAGSGHHGSGHGLGHDLGHGPGRGRGRGRDRPGTSSSSSANYHHAHYSYHHNNERLHLPQHPDHRDDFNESNFQTPFSSSSSSHNHQRTSLPPPPARGSTPISLAAAAAATTAASSSSPLKAAKSSSSKPSKPPSKPSRPSRTTAPPHPLPNLPPAPSIPSLFFSFQQGSERAQNVRYPSEASPLLGRFRAVPPRPNAAGAWGWGLGSRSGSGPGFGVAGGGAGGSGPGRGRGRTAGGGRATAAAAPLLAPGRRQTGLRSPSSSSSSSAPYAAAAAEAAGWRGSVHIGYGALVAAAVEQEETAEGEGSDGDDEDEDEDEDGPEEDDGGNGGLWASSEEPGVGCCGCFCCCGGGAGGAGDGKRWWRRARGRVRRFARRLRDTWVDPKARVIRRVVDVWWSRWGTLVVLPALLAVAWCAVPFPQYPLPGDGDASPGRKAPGHGAARVQVNFWFFLFVYYSFYNLTALIWITKVFNLYSLNWWPQSLGFPVTVSAIAILSLAVPIPLYLVPEARFLTVHNTAWISWTFVIMAIPVAIAFCILMTHERHLGLRHPLSETQRIFTSSWWAGEADGALSRRESRRHRAAALDPYAFDPDLGASALGIADGRYQRPALPVRLRRRWLPASFVRFVWFCLALFIGLLAYVIGEAYAEIYLRTLPHNNLETIVYVYGWITTVHLLDGLTGWILGGNEGERVGSYPLSWIFKLYFMLTYQTYVRALYARLRSPSQFILLQVLSSTSLIIVTPVLMSAPFHWFLCVIGMNGQSYGSYQKLCVRNVFIRFLAENASMLAFLGSVVVLHFGANKDVYPYFAFDGTGEDEDYDFGLTFYASGITWACELAASFIVAGLIRWIYKVSVVTEGKLDFIVWPELLPTSVAVVLHVLQNMLFSIIRLQFR